MKRTFTSLINSIFVIILCSCATFSNVNAQAPAGTNSANYLFSTIPAGTQGSSNSFIADLNGTPYNATFTTIGGLGPNKQNTNASDAQSVGYYPYPGADYNDIGFDFYFMGNKASQYVVNTEGILGFAAGYGHEITGASYRIGEAVSESNGQTGNEMRISPFTGWYAATLSNGSVGYKLIGTAPYRTLVIQWKNVQFANPLSGSNSATFQLRLYETTNKIDFVYDAMNVVEPTSYQAGFSYGYAAKQANTVWSLTSTNITNYTTGKSTPVSSNPITALNSTGGDGKRREIIFDPFTGTTNTPPTGLSVSNTPTSITLNWTDAPNEIAYDIYYSENPNVPLDNTTGYISAAQNATSVTIDSATITPDAFTLTQGSNVIGFGDGTPPDTKVSHVWIGAAVSDGGLGYIPAGAKITGINYVNNTITISAAATATVSLVTLVSKLVPGAIYYFKVFARREALSAPANIILGTEKFTVYGLHFTVSPNPVEDKLIINGSSLSEGKINLGIYNMLGEKIYSPQSEIGNLKSEIAVDVSSLSKGIYFVRIQNEKGNWTGKFVKE